MQTYIITVEPLDDPELQRIILSIRSDTRSHAHNTAVTVAYQLGFKPGEYTLTS